MRHCFAPFAVVAALLPAARGGEPLTSDRLAKPVLLEADGKLLARDGGGCSPFVADFDGDGKLDLLLSAARDGRLAVYRNVGEPPGQARRLALPRLAAPVYFDDAVPTGRIPEG